MLLRICHPQRRGEIALAIHVHEQHAPPSSRKRSPKVNGSSGFSSPSLIIDYRYNPCHYASIFTSTFPARTSPAPRVKVINYFLTERTAPKSAMHFLRIPLCYSITIILQNMGASKDLTQVPLLLGLRNSQKLAATRQPPAASRPARPSAHPPSPPPG